MSLVMPIQRDSMYIKMQVRIVIYGSFLVLGWCNEEENIKAVSTEG